MVCGFIHKMNRPKGSLIVCTKGTVFLKHSGIIVLADQCYSRGNAGDKIM